MKVGIFGAGNLGSAIAEKLGRQGHHLFLSFSKGTERMASFAHLIGARFDAPQDAAQFGEVIIQRWPRR